ncbi:MULTISPECIES: hydroxyethylthiazole kinase [Limosilactobacillus]|uniref:Hydroxyethylthiazole kinase n=1 Tax=Limosilactobacillus panis DSM 6035 TaxID=1423782 RepID=A0A0R1X5G2_9LACO|nr:hydroxyethylthiazole kinase [Limosilactobacillus panis]KRM24957.1 hydroxyethylthiazole kinase [Limosilactobacillus panis DSM 6035]QZN92250.1 hydroxyethylthiazole kinase [Limosilactobacillus panis]
MNKHIIYQLRNQHPIVFTIANTVTSGKVADGLSALGISPIMSFQPTEALELAKLVQAVVINLGTPCQPLEAEFDSGAAAANQLCTPLVLDPVACGSSAYRAHLARQLLSQYDFTIIRGNAGEIAALAGEQWESHGIDAGSGKKNQVDIARRCAHLYHCVVVLSGKEDIITDGTVAYQNRCSTPWLATNVGSGDLLSSTIGALLGIGITPLIAGLVGCRIITTAGTKAAQGANGLGSWQVRFLDALSKLNDQDLMIERILTNDE